MVEEHSRPVSRKGKIASRFDFSCRSFPPYSLVQSRTDDFWTVLPISDAKHCIRQRKALQVPTQSFACAIAKLCMCYRKALAVYDFLSEPDKVPSFRTPLPIFFTDTSLEADGYLRLLFFFANNCVAGLASSFHEHNVLYVRSVRKHVDGLYGNNLVLSVKVT